MPAPNDRGGGVAAWFTTQTLDDVQLDIVGFLAILGEASVLTNAQVMFLSKWCYLPRLIPAPQALIRTERPERLVPSPGKVVGSHSGNRKQELNHIAHVLHSEGDKMERYEVQCVYLRENQLESQVKAAWNSPVLGLSLLGFSFSCILLGLSIWWRDAFSLIATVLLSSLSSLIGIGSKWRLELATRQDMRDVPKSDVIINYPNGAFLIVKCDEDVARRLYWAPERCDYMIPENAYRVVSLTGTLMLMIGVICLANATNELQVAWAGAYMILNAAYWVVAAFPTRWNWFLKSFTVIDATLEEQSPSYAPDDPTQGIRRIQRTNTDVRKPGTKRPRHTNDFGRQSTTFTQALWMAIAITKTSDWVSIGQIAPSTPAWEEWLQEANVQAQKTRVDDMSLEGEKGEVTHKKVKIAKWDSRMFLSSCMQKDKRVQDRKERQNSTQI